MSNTKYCNTPLELLNGGYELTIRRWNGSIGHIITVLGATPIPMHIISRGTRAIKKVFNENFFSKHITMLEVVFHGRSLIRVRVKGESEQAILSLDVSDVRVSECSLQDYIKGWSSEVCTSFS